MSTDISVRNQNASASRIADALLRATSGATATLLYPPANGDASDAGQLGLNSPEYQFLPLAPVAFRKVRATMQEKGLPKYELLISASAVLPSVGALGLSSIDSLFLGAAGISVAGEFFYIESWAASESLGEAYLYRLLLRVSEPQSIRVGS